MYTSHDIMDIISEYKIPCSTEKKMQEEIEMILADTDIDFEREKRLNAKNIVDFMIKGGIAIECKIAGTPENVLRQLERYAEFDSVREIILVSSKSFSMPSLINNKPVFVLKTYFSWI